MLEATDEMESLGVYTEASNGGAIATLIEKVQNLFKSIREWFSKHFGKKKLPKNATIKMKQSEIDKIEKEHKFAKKLKSGIKNPKNWAILISAGSAIGLGVAAGKMHKKNKGLEKEVEVGAQKVADLQSKLAETENTLASTDYMLDTLSDQLDAEKGKRRAAETNAAKAKVDMEKTKEENKTLKGAFKSAKREAKRQQKYWMNSWNRAYSRLYDANKENEKLKEENANLTKMLQTLQAAGNSNLENAKKINEKIDKAMPTQPASSKEKSSKSNKETDTSNIASKEDIEKYSGDGKGLSSTFGDKIQAAMNKAEKKVSNKEIKPTKESTNEIMTKYNKLVSDIKSDKLNHGEYRNARATFRQELQALITNKTISKSKANELLHGITDAWDGK